MVKPIGIVGAMPTEIAKLDSNVEDKQTYQHGGVTVTTGILSDVPVVYAASGVGKTNTAHVTTVIAEKYAPEAFLFTGVAGGLQKGQSIGDILIAKDLVDYDMNVTAFAHPSEDGKQLITYDRGEFPFTKERLFTSDRTLYDLAVTGAKIAAETKQEIPLGHYGENGFEQTGTAVIPGEILTGRLGTGSEFLSTERKQELQPLWNELDIAAVEMEGAALGQVATHYGVPFVVIRALSDVTEGDSNTDFDQFMGPAADSLFPIVEHVVKEYQHRDAADRLAAARAGVE